MIDALAGFVEVPQKVQEALAEVLKAQFELGRMAGLLGERSITRKHCMPMNNALKLLIQEIRSALDAAAEFAEIDAADKRFPLE